MAFNRTQPLEERVRSIRPDLDKFIDDRAAEIKKTCEGVPVDVIRKTITRGLGCQCAAFLEIKARDDADASRAGAA
jgi:hypothetical protein